MSKFCSSLVLLFACVLSAGAAAPKPDARSKEVDAAIAKALEFLKKNQNNDGSWSAWRGGRDPALTGLGVMAFLAAGHVPGEGPYGKVIERGVQVVLKMQHANGVITGNGHHEMYSHGICTLMLAEVVGMTQGPLAKEVRQKLEKAVNIILIAQRKGRYANDPNRGGWRYRVAGIDSDMSVTGWQVMALRAAKNVGCDVPPAAIDQAVDYLKRSQNGQGAFCYTPGGNPTVACTGTGILALEICGKDKHRSPEVLRGGNYLLRTAPQQHGGHFCYSMYYCSQAMFQLGGNYWEYFRPRMHEILLRTQTSTGAWNIDSHGPSYATAMSVLALAVEYRFLPIYQRGEEPTDKK
jgi:hypothetical protein